MSKVFEIAFKLGGEITSSFKKAFDQAGGAMKVLSGAAAALGGTAALGSIISQVGDMDEALKTLSARTGIMGSDFNELEETAKSLFRNNYGDSFEDVTTALANVKQNMHELDAVDLELFTGEALSFAKVFDADINEVTRAANNMMSSFGTTASTAMDLFAAGAQRGLNFSDEMLDNVAEYAPLFGEMGYSAEEYFGILERGAQSGVYNLDYVNDVMKEFQIRVKDGSKATSEAMADMSKETQNVWKEYLKGNGTVADVASTVVAELKTMEDQVAAGQLAVSLFGTKWEDLESTAMYSMLGTTEAMKDFDEAMVMVNQIQFSSFNSAIQGIGRILFMDVIYPIGDYLLPYLNRFANFLSTNIPSAIQIAKSSILQYGPAILAVGGALIAYQATTIAVNNAQKAFNAMKALSTTLMYAYRTALLASTFAGGGLRGVLVGLRSGMVALNATMLANPIGLVVVAIAALAGSFVFLYQKSETFRTAVEPLLTTLKLAFIDALTQVKTAFASLVPVITNIASMILPQLINVVQTIIPIIVSVIQMAVPIIVAQFQLISAIIQNVVIPAINYLLPVVTAIFGYIQMAVTNFITLVKGILQSGMALLQGDWSGAWAIIKSTAETIMNNIIGFFRGINLYDVGVSIINGLINGIKSMGGAVIGAITDMVPEPLRAAASGVMNAIGIGGYATGGIVSSPELAWVGEGGDTEAIIPWNNSQRSRDLWLRTGQALGMLNKSGAIDNMQQQIAMKAASNGATPIISPSQVRNPSAGGNVIHLHYNPQYSVQNPDDLSKVKVYADKDKDDLEARLAEIKRNNERTSFDD